MSKQLKTTNKNHKRKNKSKNKMKNLIYVCLPALVAILLFSVVLFALVIPRSLAAETMLVVYQESNGQVFGQDTSIDIFNNPKLRGEKLEAPFTVDSYTFAVYNNSDSFSLPYTINFLATNEKNIPLVFSLQKNGEYIFGGENDEDMLPLSSLDLEEATLSGMKTDLYTLHWRWNTEDDVTDTALGNRAASGETLDYSLTITASGDVDVATGAAPKTGDNGNIIRWLTILFAALMLVLFLLLYKRRRKKEEDHAGDTQIY